MIEKLQPIAEINMQLKDSVGKLIDNIIKNWLIGIRESNPAILDMLKNPDLKPARNLLPWSGEFAGKYITCSVMLYQLTKNQQLFAYLSNFIAELISYQKKDGYIGCWPTDCQLTGRSSFSEEAYNTWDGWAHYHIMYGLIHWYKLTGDRAAYNCVMKIADLFCERFYNPLTQNKRLFEMGETEMNYAPIHAFAILYRESANKKYLDFALEILKDFEIPPSGDYYRYALAGKEYFETPKPRWESLHAIEALAELYYCTGNENYKKAFEHLWRSMTKTDLHNTGGFSTNEQAIGNPFENGAIETCCTVAYMALTVDMLKLSGDAVAADVLELSTYNAGLGCFSPTGKWSTYNTPMEGDKKANYWEIGFQCRPGSPDLNCCSVNAPRIFGELSNWAYMTNGEDLYIHYYGQGKTVLTVFGKEITINQTTAYPYDGCVKITVSGFSGKKRKIIFRIPFWSEDTAVAINGKHIQEKIVPGYFSILREWTDTDTVTIDFDMSLRYAAGEKEYMGKCSLYRGPLLLAYDAFYCTDGKEPDLPCIIPEKLVFVKTEDAYLCGKLFYFTIEDKPLILCDMQAAGTSGTPYTTWLPATVSGKASPFIPNITRSIKI